MRVTLSIIRSLALYKILLELLWMSDQRNSNPGERPRPSESRILIINVVSLVGFERYCIFLLLIRILRVYHFNLYTINCCKVCVANAKHLTE
jgi:hypothetical protein